MSKAEKRKLRHDRKGIPTKFNVGDHVLIRSHRLSSMTERVIQKFFLLFEGPYIIVEIKTQNAYTVEDPKTKIIRGTFNVIHLRKYLPPNDRWKSRPMHIYLQKKKKGEKNKKTGFNHE